MKNKKITGRQLRHGAPEEQLGPGQSLLIEKRSGKRFQLTRVDAGSVDFNAQMDRIFKEIPSEGPRRKTNLTRMVLEGRE